MPTINAKSPLEADLEQREHGEPIPPPDADAFDAAQRQDRGEAREPEDPPKPAPGKGTAKSPLEAEREAAERKPAKAAEGEGEDNKAGDKSAEGEPGEEGKPKIGLRNIGRREIRRSEAWDQIKSERDKYRQEAESLRAARASGPETDDVKALREERDKYRDIVRQAAIERDPQFNAEFESRRKVAVQQATLAAGDKADALGKLLALPASSWRDQQIDALMEEMPGASQRRLNAALSVLDQIEIDRQARIEQARASWDQRQAQAMEQQNQQATQRQQKLMGTFDHVLKEYQRPGDDGIYFYQTRDGDEAHNSGIQESVQIARDLLGGKLGEEDMVRAALIVGASDRLFKQMEAQESTITELRRTIKRLRGVDPDAGGRADLSDSGKPSRPPLYGESGDRDYFDQQFEAAQRADRKGKWD